MRQPGKNTLHEYNYHLNYPLIWHRAQAYMKILWTQPLTDWLMYQQFIEYLWLVPEQVNVKYSTYDALQHWELPALVLESVCVCVCPHVQILMCLCVHICALALRAQRCHIPRANRFDFETEAWGSMNRPSWPARGTPGIQLSPTPQNWAYNIWPPCLAFYVGSGNCNTSSSTNRAVSPILSEGNVRFPQVGQ